MKNAKWKCLSFWMAVLIVMMSGCGNDGRDVKSLAEQESARVAPKEKPVPSIASQLRLIGNGTFISPMGPFSLEFNQSGLTTYDLRLMEDDLGYYPTDILYDAYDPFNSCGCPLWEQLNHTVPRENYSAWDEEYY